MPDIRDRFRSLDNQGAPDLWNEASDRSRADSPQPSWLPRIGGALAVAVVMVLGVFIGLQLTGGGPLIGGDPSPSAESSPSAAPTELVEPSAVPTEPAGPSVEPSAGPSGDGGPPFICDDTPIQIDAAGSDFHPLIVADIRLGAHESVGGGHDGYDRIVFEYVDDGTPELRLERDDPPFVMNPSGLPLTVDGSPTYSVIFIGAAKYDMETGEEPYTGSTDFTPGYEQIAQFVESGDFEAVHSWYLGTNGSSCLRAFVLTDPSRVVIDIHR